MKLKEFDILLDIKRNKKVEEFEIVQGDHETNILKISLVEDFNEYELSGLSVEIAFAKSDGTTVLQDLNNGISLVGNKILCTLKTNTIASPGKVLAEVRVLQGLKLLTSSRFSFFVRQSIVNNGTIESTNEFPVLNQMIQDVSGLLDEIQSKPEIQGYSAYQVWLNEGNVGTVDDYLASLIGPPGEIGPQGNPGPQGERGFTGSIDNLDSNNITEALGYTPADDIKIGPLASLLTTIKTSIVNAINSLKGEVDAHKAEIVSQLGGVHGLKIEIGNFTPVLIGLATTGSNTYSAQKGIYYKIGQLVFIDAYIVLTAKDTAMAGDIVISGLPFVILTGGSGNLNAFSVGMAANITHDGTLAASSNDGYSYINLLNNKTGIYATNINADAIANNTIISISGSYITTNA